MAYDYFELLARARNWAEQALAEGRLDREQAQTLLSIDSRSPESLFSAGLSATESTRPLIVAFMGGTGVGKSSLLNRLAGKAIARAGIERPTSREVTLYHHQSVSIQQLPAGLPLDSIKISQHDDIDKSNIVWIDMPDFDSIELGNKRLVLEWLPHIDALLYVVSPERYRDNKAWQLLLAEGAKHAWLFVMNQWDRGLAVQYEDFKQQLHKAGFDDPLVFRTSCSEPDGDEFADLLAQLQQLSGRLSIAQLERRGHEMRGQQLKQILQALLDQINGRDYQQLSRFYGGLWQNTEIHLQQGLAWPLQQLAQFWAAHSGQKNDIQLWDDWAQSRFNDALDELILQAVQIDIPSKPLKSGLQDIKNQAEKKISQSTEVAGRQALLNPGNGLQRFLLGVTAIGETLLPIAAMSVVGYQVFYGYYHGATETNAYLGVDFAIHSVLLIGLSWLIPFFLHKKIQPSLQNAALKGLQKGLRQALLALDAEIKALLRDEQQRNTLLQKSLTELIEHCESTPMSRVEKDSLLDRVLLSE
ncbi:MAG: GTPase domain-containing protein [Methylococcaceae bacterium]|nr:GTPase domain-containing protein [Methylococcaceae bacterium]